MIRTTRLNDSELLINADLIETIEATPDTVITLIDGTRFIVCESPDELVDRIQRYRAGLLALRNDPQVGSAGFGSGSAGVTPLALVGADTDPGSVADADSGAVGSDVDGSDDPVVG